MSNFNAVPGINFNGIDDNSRGTIQYPELTFPQHCPLVRLFCETGPTETTFIGNSNSAFMDLFGQQTLNPRSKYFNTQSLLTQTLLSQANGFYVKRVVPSDAGNPARVIMALEIVPDLIPKTITTLSGFNYPNQTEVTTPSTTTEMIEGYRARLIQISDNTSEVGTQRVLPGTMTTSLGQSTVYPLYELPYSFVGEQGNYTGHRIWAPTELDPEGYDVTVANQFKTRMYRVQFVKQLVPGSNPTIIKTNTAEDFVDVTFDPGVYSESLNKEYAINEVLIDNYQDDGYSTGRMRKYSPFSQIYVYHDNIDAVRELIYQKELEVNPAIAASVESFKQIDFLTMLQEDGDPYHSVLLEGPLNGGVLVGKANTVYALGGSDGTTSLDEYYRLVDIENLAFGKLGDNYNDIGKYQFGVLYDTGMPMESKFRSMAVLGARSDLIYRYTPFVEQDTRPLTLSEEISRVQAIMTRLKAYPESLLNGTKVCRADIVMQSGKWVDGGWRKNTPLIIDDANAWAAFAGNGSGALVDGKDIDQDPNNRVTKVKDLNFTFMDLPVRAQAWANGATYAQTYDLRSNYYPCRRSVYLDDTSVLLSPVTVSICCVLMRIIYMVHADFSGNASLTKEQLCERSDERIRELTRDRFGDRVVITPRTYISAADDANGFSWSCEVTVAANNPRTVLNFSLVTVRRDADTAIAGA